MVISIDSSTVHRSEDYSNKNPQPEKAKGSRDEHLVQLARKHLHEIRGELVRWKIILAVPYQEYLLSK